MTATPDRTGLPEDARPGPAGLADPVESDGSALQRYADALADTGYADLCSSFNPLFPRPGAWGALAEGSTMPRPLRALVRLFLLGQPVPAADLVWDTRTGEGVQLLLRLGLLEQDGADVMSQARLLHLFGLWHFSTEGRATPVVYVGDDSMALLLHSAPSSSATTALDLCAGGGIQSLWAARSVGHVTAVELDAEVCRYVSLNAAMNGLAHRVEVRCGDLYAPVRGRRFDHVTANPPLVPIPAGIDYPAVGDGGPDGLALFWRVIDGMLPALSPSGTGHVLGTCFSDGVEPALDRPLARWAEERGADVHLTVIARQRLARGQPFFDAVVEVVVAHSGLDRPLAQEAMAELADAHGGWLANVVVRLSHGQGRFMTTNLAHGEGANVWFATPRVR